MNDVNDRVIEAVGEVMLKRPGIDPSLALRFALEADRELARDYHMAGDTGPDPGHNHPNTVKAVPIASVNYPPERRHYSELSATERVRELRKLGVNCAVVHKLSAPEYGGGFHVALVG